MRAIELLAGTMGEQAELIISGRTARRTVVVFLNVLTRKLVQTIGQRTRGEDIAAGVRTLGDARVRRLLIWDNAPPHQARVARGAAEALGIEIVNLARPGVPSRRRTWPSRSPGDTSERKALIDLLPILCARTQASHRPSRRQGRRGGDCWRKLPRGRGRRRPLARVRAPGQNFRFALRAIFADHLEHTVSITTLGFPANDRRRCLSGNLTATVLQPGR